MARPAAVIRLAPEEHRAIKQYVRSGTTEQRSVERGRVILLASEGQSTEQIAQVAHPTGSHFKMAAAFCQTSFRRPQRR